MWAIKSRHNVTPDRALGQEWWLVDYPDGSWQRFETRLEAVVASFNDEFDDEVMRQAFYTLAVIEEGLKEKPRKGTMVLEMPVGNWNLLAILLQGLARGRYKEEEHGQG